MYFDGAPIPDPGVAPVRWLSLPSGDPANLPPGTRVTIQGVVRDPSSPSRKRASVTNAIVLVVE